MQLVKIRKNARRLWDTDFEPCKAIPEGHVCLEELLDLSVDLMILIKIIALLLT